MAQFYHVPAVIFTLRTALHILIVVLYLGSILSLPTHNQLQQVLHSFKHKASNTI